MTIQKRIILFFVAIVLILLTVILLMGYRLTLQERLTQAEKERYESYRLAVQLKGTADQLTQMIRTYTLTANPHYREYYRHILDIRSGKEPRPEGYDLLFWDLIDFSHEYTPPKEGKRVPFSTLLKEAKIDEQEISKLREAQAYADRLADIEREALHLMDLASIDDDLSNSNRLAAQQILFGTRYRRIRREMMLQIKEFFTMIDRRTSAQVDRIRRKQERIDYQIFGLVLLLLFIALLSWIHSRKKIVDPLQELIQWTDRLKNGEFSIQKTIHGRDEIAQLARSFKTMAESIHLHLDKLNTMAHTDRLTGLGNRTQLDLELQKTQIAVQYYGLHSDLILIDIDHFKAINDRYGHETGDRVLAAFGEFLRNHLPEPHMAGRWGGEEFLLIVKNLNLQEAAKLAEELKEELAAERFPYEEEHISASFGVAPLRADLSLEESFACADRALYRAKEAGRNRVEVEECRG
ncbi:diguanylate cyclase [Nitratifractor sp.]